MAAFINNDITTAGLIVLAKGVAGQKINYTKIVLGDGFVLLGLCGLFLVQLFDAVSSVLNHAKLPTIDWM